jgi:hypothetical protein
MNWMRCLMEDFGQLSSQQMVTLTAATGKSSEIKCLVAARTVNNVAAIIELFDSIML